MEDYISYVHVKYEHVYSMLHSLAFGVRSRSLTEQIQPLMSLIREARRQLQLCHKSLHQVNLLHDRLQQLAVKLQRLPGMMSYCTAQYHRQIYLGLNRAFGAYAMDKAMQAYTVLQEIVAEVTDIIRSSHSHHVLGTDDERRS